MARTLFGYVGLAATLVFALPAILLGVEFLLFRGRTTLGAGLIVAGVLMIVVEERVTTPGDVPGMIAKQTVGRVASDPGADDEED